MSSEKIIETFWSDKFGKFLLRLAGVIIILFLITVIVLAIMGRHINVFGLEINKKESSDTVRISEPIIVYLDTTVKTITPNELTNSKEKAVHQKKPAQTTPDTITKIKNQNTGTNNGNMVIGDNGTLNVNEGRHLTEQKKVNLINLIEGLITKYKLPKDILIEFGTTIGSEEAAHFSMEVAKFVASQGYKIDPGISPTMGNNEFTIKYIESDKKIFIDVGLKGIGVQL
jgi:hypothetical protein